MFHLECRKAFLLLIIGLLVMASSAEDSSSLSQQQFEKNLETYLVKVVPSDDSSAANELANCLMAHISNDSIHPYYSLTRSCSDMDSARLLGTKGFVSSSTLLKYGLKLVKNPIVITKLDDLKHLPFTIDGTPVVLHTNDLSGLTRERAEKLLSVAQLKHIKISIIVRGLNSMEASSPFIQEASRLAQESGGVMLGL
jgi:hypothetical protein